MFDQRVLIPEQFPVTQKNRKSTDVCCTIIGAIFALTMFIVACCLWSQGNYDKLTSLTASEQNDIQENLFKNSDVSGPENFFRYRPVLLWCGLIALGIGLLWMTITHCFPRLAPIIAFVFAILGLIALGVLLLVLDGGFWRGGNAVKIITAVVCFVLALLLIIMLCMYSSQVKFQGIMLEYSVRFLNENPCTFTYVPLYLLFTAGLFALIFWQQACFSSWWGQYIGFGTGGVWGVLNVLELIWGLQFLRDSFNFCVSGAAVDWYWTKNSNCYAPYQRLLCKHWGSVVGGSFLNAFFEIPTLLIELIVCHPQTCCAKLGTVCYNSCNCCTCFFDLVRTDAYSYMNLSGIPFCDSARQCKKICDRSRHFVGTHSAMKHYRFVATVACVTLAMIASYFVLRFRVWNFGIWHFGFLVFWIYAIITWFVNIHADAAEGLQTSFLAEHELENDYNFMQRILPSYRKELGFLDGRQKMDGNC